VSEEETADFVRVRAFHVTDDDIKYVTTHFTPNKTNAGTSPQSEQDGKENRTVGDPSSDGSSNGSVARHSHTEPR